jgi:uncharacterized protein
MNWSNRATYNLLDMPWAENYCTAMTELTIKSDRLDTDVSELQSAVNRLVANLEPERIILFGSHAYGSPGPDSDIDLLIIMNTEEGPAERIRTVSRLLSPRPFPVDIVVRTPSELARDLKKIDSFMRDIVEKGRVLYEHP